MRTRAFLIHLPLARAHLLSELPKCGLDVAFFTTNDAPNEGVYGKLAPDVPHCTNAHALSGRAPELGGPTAARVEDIEKLAPTAVAALHCLDRSNSTGRAISELQAIYLGHVGQWRRMLERYDPQVVVFTDNPHHGWDNVLYDLCKADGRQTILFGYTDLPRRVVLKSAIEDTPGPTLEEIETASKEDLPDLERDPVNLHIHEKINNLSGIKKKLSLFGAARLLVGVRQFGRAPPSPYFFEDETPRLAKVRWYKFVNRVHGRALWQQYDQLAIEPDVACKYVYFPMPMQPEMSTVPLGGHFGEQLNLVRTLSACLPAGWKIYVKEHPHQFVWPLTVRGRTQRGYELLHEVPGVEFITMHTNSQHLAKHAQAVATATGTAAFEGINFGVPALIFGSPWYSRAPGAIKIRTLEECRQAFARIAKGELRPTMRRLRAFKHLMMTRYTVETIFDPQMALETDKAPEETAARVATRIRQIVDQAHGPTLRAVDS